MGKRGRAGAIVLAFISVCSLAWAGGAAAVRKSSSVEQSIRDCANRERRERGLGHLKHDPALDLAARLHARRMRSQRFFDHKDPNGDGPADRVQRFAKRRYVVVGENIAVGFDSIGTVCREWMRSRSHRTTMLRAGFSRIGAGYASGSRHHGPYYVQVFADVAG
jgi:uncharacterized protein YkwD